MLPVPSAPAFNSACGSQARSVKSLLQEAVPGIKCWLDVDNMRSKAGTSATDKESFSRLIDEQHSIIALLTGSLQGNMVRSDYFRSAPCLSECRRGYHNGTPIVFLQETDVAQYAAPPFERPLVASTCRGLTRAVHWQWWGRPPSSSARLSRGPPPAA